MTKKIYHDGDEGVLLILEDKDSADETPAAKQSRSPVHVVYGGADRFTAGTPQKLGRLALAALQKYAPDAAAFAEAFDIAGPELSEAVYRKTVEKLQTEPVEDFRIDFEDGYGFRSDEDEDADAVRSARELAESHKNGTITPVCGFRVKSLGHETADRAMRTLGLFVREFFARTENAVPDNFVVTLPKITDRSEIKQLAAELSGLEKEIGLPKRSIGIEIVIETPRAIFDRKGKMAMPRFAEAADGRLVSAHFGAYDYTSSLGIAGQYQDIRHPSCVFARHMMQAAFAPLGVRVSDSVTTQLPVPVHRGGDLTASQEQENIAAVHSGWRRHFSNVTASIADGFYQSWDLHPNQLVARYAAVYKFFFETRDEQAARLKSFIEKATKATLVGSTFDDAASAQGLVNFFRRAIESRAVTEDELKKLTGLSADELTLSFDRLMKNRRAS